MMHKEDIAKKYKHLYQLMSLPKFQKMETLGGEIPFFISAYNPEQEVEISKAIKGLKNKLESDGLEILELNLYQISMQILKDELGEGEIFELEEQMEKDEFKAALQSVLDLNEVLMPHLKSIIDKKNASIYFLTGVGTCYPFLRSHNILNNLHNIAKDAPTVMFFPGRYTGKSLDLFGKLKDDNYYRAFDLDSLKI